jgi:uncharacterized protein (TIRG00374 family)
MKRWLPYLISALLLVCLFWFIDLGKASRLLAEINPALLCLGTVCYIGSLLVRGLRFKLLMKHLSPNPVGLDAAIDLAALVTFANHVLPFRMGEAVFILMSKLRHRLNPAHGLIVLLTARLYDLISLLLLFTAAAMLIDLDLARGWRWGLAALLIVLLAAALRLDWALRLGLSLCTWAGKMLKLDRTKIGQKIISTLGQAHQGLHHLRSPAMIAANIGLSLAVWLCVTGAFHLLIKSFGLAMGFDKVVVGSMWSSLTALLPVNAVGNIGTWEAGWSLGFTALGMDSSDSVFTGMAIHVIVIAASGLLAAVYMARNWESARNIIQSLRKDDPKH